MGNLRRLFICLAASLCSLVAFAGDTNVKGIYAGNPPYGSYDSAVAAFYGGVWGSVDTYCGDATWHMAGVVFDEPAKTVRVTCVRCTGDENWDDATKSCKVPGCQSGTTAASGYVDIGTSSGARPPLMPCINGCQAMVGDLTSPAGSAMVEGSKHYYALGSYVSTGASCTATAENTMATPTASVPEDSCAAGQAKGTVNGKTVCVNQSGTSGGTATGEKGSTVTTTATSTSVAADGTSSRVTETVTSNADGTASKTTTLTVMDGSGNVVSSKTTTVGDSPSAGSGSGSGSGGSGSGTGCEANPMGAGCGGEKTAIDSLYEKKPETLQQVFDARKSEFMASPVGTAVGSFFNVSGGGSCPTWQATIPWINAQMVIDQWCAPFVTNNLGIIRTVILCYTAFFAFRVAVE